MRKPILRVLLRRELGKRIDEHSMHVIVDDMEKRARLSGVPPYPREEERFKCWSAVMENLFNADMARYMASSRPVSQPIVMVDPLRTV